VCDIVVKKFAFAISSPDEFLSSLLPQFCVRAVSFTTTGDYIKLFSVICSSI